MLAYRRGDATRVYLNLGTTEVQIEDVVGTIAVGTERARDGETVTGSLTLASAEAVIITTR